jgi:hypothetical protein
MSQNAPLDFVLFNQNVQLDYYYVVDADTPFASVPEHDVAILALGESTQHNALHAHIEANRRKWPRPFLNHAPGVMRCARDRLFALLKDDHELKVPCTLRVERRDLKNELPPYLIRPIDTHAGDGFEKIPDLEALAFYLDRHFSDWFYVSEYIDCAMDDGLFRKFRIALIDKQPFICHYAISENWIVHYKSAHMELSLQKRKEEEKFMLEFEDVFLVKHGACLRRVAEKIDLDYVVLDCAESADGRLVLFEADNGAWIHDTDPQEIFPYKSKVMNRAFSAFTQMLLKAQSCGSDREARA